MKQKLLLALLALFTLGGSNLFAQLENGTVYWIQDASTGQFISQGDNWSTRAVAQNVGGLGFEAVYVSDGVYKLNHVMWNTVRNTTVGLGVDVYVDQTPVEWTITASGDGYTIKNGDNYLVNNGQENSYKEKPINKTTDASEATVWKFLTRTEYDAAIQAYKNGNATSYAASMGYNDVTSVETLETLIGDADKFISKDYTNSITNPTLGSNWDGWTHGAISQRGEGAGVGSGCAEFWNGCGYAKQTVSGLPTGLFKVTFVSAYRPGDGNITLESEKASSPAFVYANDAEIEFLHWVDVPAKANGRSSITTANGYGQSFYTYVSDGTLALGVVADGWMGDNGYIWQPFGQFTLTYYTDKVTDEQITALVATIPTTIPTALKESLNGLKSDLETAKTISSYNALAKAIEDAKKVETIYSNYPVAKANVLALKSQTSFTDEGGTAATQLDADIAAADVAVEAATTVEGVNDAIKQVRTAAGKFAGAVKVNKGEYLDLTDAMLFNAAMRETGGLSLWNIVSNTNSAYPKYNGRCSEFWGANFEFNQTAYNMPAGNYNIEVYAFHRAGNYNTYLYANNDKIQVLPIANGENSMDAAANAFDQGLYLNSLKITLDEAQDVVIGFKNEDGDETDKWTIFRDFKIKFFGDDALAVFRDEYESALAEAEAALASEDYANVTGEEKTALNTAVTETYPKTVVEVDETQEKFETATAALKEATTIFKSAKAAYDKFAAAKAAAAGNKVDYPYASAEKLATYQANLTDATTATEASTKADAIVPSYRAYVESNALAEGVEGAVDLTSKIKQDAIADWTAEITGSTATFVLKNADGNDADTYTAADGTKGKNLIDSGNLWGASSWTAKMTQNVNLTPGKYILTASSRGSNDLSTFKLLADDKSVDMDHTGAAEGNGVFDRGFNDYYVEFELTEPKDVVIGFEAATEAAHNWCSVARFRLAQLESTAEWATDEDLTAFAEALQATAKLGFDEGDYAPYNNVESLTAAEAEVAKVNTELEAYEGKATKATVAAATEAVKALTWVANETEMNAVYDGTFANAVNNGAPAGWTMSNNTLGGDYHSRAFNPDERLAEFNETKSGFFIRFDGTNSNRGSMYFYGRTTGYTMPLKANTTYYVKADFAGWGSTGKPLRMNVTGPEGFTAVGSTQTTAVNADNANEVPQQFLIVFTTADAGNYQINFQTPGADTNTHNALVSNIELFKAQPVNITIKKGRQYTAFSSNMPLDFTNSELTAEIVTSTTGTTQKVKRVPANTGIIVGLAAATAEAKTISVPVCAGETDDVTGNMLVAVLEATTIQQTVDGYTNYVFGKSGGKEQFFKVRATGMEVPANNAYLTIPDAQAKGLDEIGLNGDATGISTIENADMQNGEVYNLQGQKVNRAQKGVYIVNGKKVILK